MAKPIIGIPMNRLTSDDEHYTGLPIFYTHEGFPKGLIKAGGTPIFFPLTQKAETEYYLDLVDAVIFTGGQDLSPHLYGEEPGFKLQNISHERDIFEMAVFHSAWKRKLPILGVCRGMQLMNVSLGGSLYQDLSENPDVRIQHVQKSATNIATHSIRVKANSWISQSYFDGDLVNSYHHQGVKKSPTPSKPPPGAQTASSKPSKPKTTTTSQSASNSTPNGTTPTDPPKTSLRALLIP